MLAHDSAVSRLLTTLPGPSDAQRQHRPMFAVDIAGFSKRAPHLHKHLRMVLYHLIRESCETTGLSWQECHHADRGDGILVITPSSVDFGVLVNPLPTRIGGALREHNRNSAEAAQIRLRMSVHAGYVQPDDHGVSGPEVIHLCRLLEADGLKAQVTDPDRNLALIVSDYLYHEAKGYALVEPCEYQAITVKVKETRARAWLWLKTL